jgi:hypothetical protein
VVKQRVSTEPHGAAAVDGEEASHIQISVSVVVPEQKAERLGERAKAAGERRVRRHWTDRFFRAGRVVCLSVKPLDRWPSTFPRVKSGSARQRVQTLEGDLRATELQLDGRYRAGGRRKCPSERGTTGASSDAR